jgi:hypothetical protein
MTEECCNVESLRPNLMIDKIAREGVAITAPGAAFRCNVPLAQNSRMLRESCNGSRGVTDEDPQVMNDHNLLRRKVGPKPFATLYQCACNNNAWLGLNLKFLPSPIHCYSVCQEIDPSSYSTMCFLLPKLCSVVRRRGKDVGASSHISSCCHCRSYVGTTGNHEQLSFKNEFSHDRKLCPSFCRRVGWRVTHNQSGVSKTWRTRTAAGKREL